MIRFICVLIALFSFSLYAQDIAKGGGGRSGVMIEPFMGVESGTISGIGNFNGGYSAVRFGLDLGYSLVGAYLVFDAGFGAGKHQQDFEGKSYQNSVTDWGFLLGYDMPFFPTRVYGGYLVKSELYLMPADTKVGYSGNGYKFGMSFTLLGNTYLNVEYKVVDIDKKKQDGIPTNLDQSTLTAIIFTLSVPLFF